MLWLLGSVCALHRIPFDAALVAQQFPPPLAFTDALARLDPNLILLGTRSVAEYLLSPVQQAWHEAARER